MSSYEWACQEIAAFLGKGSYGELILTIQKGEVVALKTVKSEKPPVDV